MTNYENGLTAEIYRAKYRSDRCVLGDVHEITIVGVIDDCEPVNGGRNVAVTPLDKGSRVFPATDDRPPVVLVLRQFGGRKLVHVEPAPTDDPDTWKARPWYAAGGSYVGDTDSRFGEAISALLNHDFYGALKLHDFRFEAGDA